MELRTGACGIGNPRPTPFLNRDLVYSRKWSPEGILAPYSQLSLTSIILPGTPALRPRSHVTYPSRFLAFARPRVIEPPRCSVSLPRTALSSVADINDSSTPLQSGGYIRRVFYRYLTPRPVTQVYSGKQLPRKPSWADLSVVASTSRTSDTPRRRACSLSSSRAAFLVLEASLDSCEHIGCGYHDLGPSPSCSGVVSASIDITRARRKRILRERFILERR